jgi:hypothetical protein
MQDVCSPGVVKGKNAMFDYKMWQRQLLLQTFQDSFSDATPKFNNL